MPGESANTCGCRDRGGVQRLASAQIYDERKYLVDQQVADGGQRTVAARISTNYFASGLVDQKISDLGKRKYVTATGFAGTKPRRASCKPRSQKPSRVNALAFKTPGETYPHSTSARPRLDRRKFGKRTVCYDSKAVGLLTEVADPRFL
jgi:hypothetical protein